jgi:hypothetical protein
MKEILKIFLNIVLWRKIKKDLIIVCCYVCDIGLMIDNKTINVMALFCLAQLSENQNSHKYIFSTVNPAHKDSSDSHPMIRQISIRDNESPDVDQNA